jgi:hypothetical protein
MRLRNIFEGLKNEVAIIFGRFNPPHKGHRAAWELASKSPIWYVGTNQSTVGPKDPLPYDVKVEAMKTIWPSVEGHIIAETSWLTLASLVYEKHGDVHLLCFTDEDWVTKTILQYNGKEGPHGFYNFKRIDQRPTPRLSSATALRDAVAKGDREAFSAAAGVDADTPVGGKPFFDLVSEYLMPYQNAPKKVAKKKVAAPVEGVAEGDKKPHPKTWHDVDAKLGKQVDKMTQAEKVRKGLANPDTLKKKGVAEGLNEFAPNDGGSDEEDTLLKFARMWYNGDDDTQQKVEQALARQGWEIGELESEEGGAFVIRAGDENGDSYIGFAVADLTENTSNAMAQTASRLANKDDGKVAKLRAAGDKRREEHLKGRDIAKRDSTSKDEWGDMKKEDAAGVGIITKQNSTVDVNKGTPRKNLKAFRLVK